MRVRLTPWDNSDEIRVSNESFAQASIQTGDVLQSEVADGESIPDKTLQHKSLKERMEAYESPLNLSVEITWGIASGDEVWE